MSHPSHSPSLKTILTSSVVIAAVLPFLCAGVVLVATLGSSMEKDIGNRNRLIAQSLAGEVERFLQEPLGLIGQIRRMIESGLLAEQQGLDAYLSTVLASYRYFERVEVLDHEGAVRLVTPYLLDHIGNSMSGQRFFQEASRSSDPYWSPTFLSFQTGAPTLTLAVSTRGGMVVGYLNLAVISRIIDRVRLEGGGYAAVLDAEGNALAHQDASVVAQRLNFSNEPFFRQAQQGEAGTLRQDSDHGTVLVSTATVPLTRWVVFVSQPEKAALAPVRKTVGIISAGIAAAITLTLLIALISLHKFLKPISELAAHSSRIAQGDYQLPASTAGYREVEELSFAFMEMAMAVEGREAELSRSEQRFRELFEESPIALSEQDFSSVKKVIDSLGFDKIEKLAEHLAHHPEVIGRGARGIVVRDVNRATRELYGAGSREELQGHPGRLLPEDFTSVLQNEVIQLLRSGRFEVETKNRTLQGKEIDVVVRGTFAREYENTWAKVLVSVHDQTERNRILEERRILEVQLQQAQKLESLGTLAGGVAHDFNNLLMGIQGRTSLMMLDLGPDHPHMEHLRGIEDHVRSAANLTNQLLGFARGGKYESHPTVLNEVVEKTGRMFGRTRKQIRLVLDLSPDLHVALVDRNQIEQVLLNLFVNAAQAMPQGGELTIRTRNTEMDPARADSLHIAPGDYACISVTDTGTGMDAGIQDRIFEPFFSTKELGRGTGLGLASSYGILRNHGGTITVKSRKGHGSTFEIFLPKTTEAIESERERTSGPSLTGTETILLVDDEPMIRDVGLQLLSSIGYRVMTAADGASAIALFKADSERIDLVILDIIMPDIDGRQIYDALKRIRPSLRVLLASGYSIDGEAAELLRQGCDGFIQKPFNLHEIAEKIRLVLDGPGKAAS